MKSKLDKELDAAYKARRLNRLFLDEVKAAALDSDWDRLDRAIVAYEAASHPPAASPDSPEPTEE